MWAVSERILCVLNCISPIFLSIIPLHENLLRNEPFWSSPLWLLKFTPNRFNDNVKGYKIPKFCHIQQWALHGEVINRTSSDSLNVGLWYIVIESRWETGNIAVCIWFLYTLLHTDFIKKSLVLYRNWVMNETSFMTVIEVGKSLYISKKMEEQGQKVLKYLYISTLLFKLWWLKQGGHIFYNFFRLSSYGFWIE